MILGTYSKKQEPGHSGVIALLTFVFYQLLEDFRKTTAVEMVLGTATVEVAH